jgi:nucleoside 2-deoxyribosyltransferase
MSKPFVFVLMPFDNQFDDVYKLGIKATCEDLNTYCERLDEQIFEENMLERIYNQINKADIIVADLTGKNANVFYETGYAHALNKKVILLTKSADDIPFDLKHYSHIIYSNIINLKEELKKRVEWYLSNPQFNHLPDDNGLKLYINGLELIPGQKVQILDEGFFGNFQTFHGKTAISIKVDILNSSNEAYRSSLKIGVLIKDFYGIENIKEKKQKEILTIPLTENNYLHVSNNFPALYPQAWESIEYDLLTNYNPQIIANPIPAIIRIFSELGIKDIPIELACEYLGFGTL